MFADDIKIFRAVTSATDCVLLQTDIDSIRGWCAVNAIKLKYDKTRIITFTRNTNIIS